MENLQKIHIISCSGASNTGDYADKVARKLDEKGLANMVCMAKVAIGDQPGKTPVMDEKINEIVEYIKNIA